MFGKITAALRLDREIEDYNAVDEKIKGELLFQGTNLWILIFAIIVACVGLNINSPPVLIGAMLISPLMGPINGMGYSVATHNFLLFQKSIKNLAFAVLGSVITSTVYFFISPLSNPTPEILLRTSPTVYDVVVAFFGGLAGMTAISSKQKGNVIPGVAIATALMPPLCTAGFGIATWQLSFFFNAMYLFIINTVCMTISGLLIAQIIGYPSKKYITEKKRKNINRILSIVLIVTILPSIYLGYRLVQNEKFKTSARSYIEDIAIVDNNYLLKSSVDAKSKTIELTYGGLALSDDQKAKLIEIAQSYSLNDAQIKIVEGFSFETFSTAENEAEAKLKAEINKLNMVISNSQRAADSIVQRTQLGKILLSEISAIYPTIYRCSYSEALAYSSTDSIPVKESMVFIHSSESIADSVKAGIQRWVNQRIRQDNIKIYFMH